MSFQDALVETCTIYNKTTSRDADTFQDKENRTAVYTNIPCRLHMTGQSNSLNPAKNAQFGTDRQRILMVKTEHGGALPGYSVLHDGQTYIISEKKKVYGGSSTPNHVIYILDKASPENES